MSNDTCRDASSPVHVNGAPVIMRDNCDDERRMLLRVNSEAYGWLVREAQAEMQEGGRERTLRKLERAALFATLAHTGRFADGAIENIALMLGREMEPSPESDGDSKIVRTGRETTRRILHVFTQVMGIGGHTRMVHHWIRQDKRTSHSVILLNQEATPVPKWLADAIQESGGELIVLPSGWHLERKARRLREFAKKNADLVVLHHHCWDVVPTVAFAVKDCPPVAVLNHADHIFWTGSSVADLVINLRSPGAEHSRERRAVSPQAVLPIPLVDGFEQSSRTDARKALGIPEEQVVILSVGRAEKYRPCGVYDFIATAGRLLDQLPEAHLYVVGVSNSEMQPFLCSRPHDRLHLMGAIEDPSVYRTAADIYVESFPFGSQTALLEAALCGLPVVPAYAPLFQLLVANDDSIQDLIPNPRSEQEYIERVKILACDPEQRRALGKNLRARLLATHVDKGWLEQLNSLYRVTDLLTHSPHPIRTLECESSDADLGVCMWHAMSRGSCSTDAEKESQAMADWNVASVARQIGCYSVARCLAWRAVCREPGQMRYWRLLLLGCLGKAGGIMKHLKRVWTGKSRLRPDLIRTSRAVNGIETRAAG